MMSVIAAGFSDPVLGAQIGFRTVMEAIARPGSVRALPGLPAAPPPLSPVAAAIALTLTDYDTPIWLDGPLAAVEEVTAWLRFHTGAPVIDDPARAAFAFLAEPAQAPPFSAFALGTPEYPDRSTTLVMQMERLSGGPALTLAGPGIVGSQELSAAPLPPDIATRLAANRALFPRGVDLLMVSADAVMALPRSTRVTAGG